MPSAQEMFGLLGPHDVFLSFRGTDTRNTFTDHLYTALVNAGIRTFRDDPDLERGEHISEALIRAIQGSRISVVVISPGYADSPWCLDELVRIVACRKDPELEQKVLPIFYHVDPSDVRHLKGSFGDAIKNHKDLRRRTQDEISRWRSALREVANLSGFLSMSNDGSEAKCIKEIVDDVSRILNNTYLNVAVYPVGIESHIKDICDSLSGGKEDDVRMVGILGMGGSGKTSLAKAVYNKFYHTFEYKSFLGNVRATAKESSNGKVTLQERLFSDILKPTKIEVRNADQGINVIKERLGSKEVLVVVDDVDERDQLIALALLDDSFGWRKTFGPGSRIIVTTRDWHLLKLLEVDEDKIHRTRGMKEEEAKELFSWHAFHDPCPDPRFSELTRRVITYCKGLPLALEVLGSFLFKRSQKHWKDTLKNLEKFPDGKIDEILKISFDALNEDQREIFLHICCFFVGMDKKYVTHILHGCGHSSEAGISILLQRCLATVSERNKLMMHDLLRDMGREVVRVESRKEPEERSRLWRQKEVIDVLTEESGTKKIEGLALNLQRSADKMSFRTKALKKMKKLKLLQLSYVQLDEDSEYYPRRLTWLCWRGFDLPTIPKDFLNEQNLVSIDLRYSNLVQVWEQSRLLKKLKILNLSHSHDLTQTPDFSNLPNLKYLVLKDCKSLPEIDKSIGDLRRLVLVNLKDCIILKYLPESFYNLKSVENLVLTGCSRFQELSDDIGNMTSLTTLRVSRTAISQVPSSLKRLKLNYSSRQDLILVKQRFPDVPRNHLLALVPQAESPILNNCIPASGDLPTKSKDLELDAALAIIPNSSKASTQNILVSRQSILQGLTANGEGNVFNYYISPGDLSKLKRMCASLLNRDSATSLEEMEADHYTNALEVVRNLSETQMQSILQGLTANGEGDLFSYYISPSDLSNLKRMCFDYCASLLSRDLETSLKELEADHYTNALEVVPNFSETSSQSTLQGLTAREEAVICLAGNDFPKRFKYVRKSDQVFFQVPQVIGCNLKALNVRVVCSLHFSDDMSPSRNSIVVTNHTKRICFVVRPACPTEITSLHEVIWQGNLSNIQLRLEGGDFLQVEVVAAAGLRVKKTGVSLVWDPNLIIENFVECEPIPYEDFRSDADYQAGPTHDSFHEDRPLKRLKFVLLIAVLVLLALLSYGSTAL